jgi:glycosyltransferase involved in cell wall biosynthesis
MRVAFVMPGVGVVTRGAEAFIVELCTRLAALPGFEVRIFCRGPAPAPLQATRIRALPRDQPLVNALYRATRLGRKALDSLYLDPLSLEWYTAALSATPHLWRGGFDAVVMEGGLVGAWLCRLLRRRRGVPFIDVAHGLDPKWEGAFARQRPDRVVTFTAAAAAMLRAQAPGAAIEIIPHGVDLQRFRPGAGAPSDWTAGGMPPPGSAGGTSPQGPAGGIPPQGWVGSAQPGQNPQPGFSQSAGAADAPQEIWSMPRPRILCAGAVDAHKRMHLAVEAVARLPAGGSLTVLGDGPEAAALDRLAAARLGAGRYLRRTVPHAAMPAWYTAADCFTLPSRSESFGLVYLEALASGVPVVAPDDAVRREVIGEAGLYCDVAYPAAYAAALSAALGRDWGELPRHRAERFPIEATVSAYATLLRSLHSEDPRRRRRAQGAGGDRSDRNDQRDPRYESDLGGPRSAADAADASGATVTADAGEAGGPGSGKPGLTRGDP